MNDLYDAAKATIDSFEALGRTTSVADTLLQRNNCEAKMILLKRAVENAKAPCDTCINFDKWHERHLYKESCATCCHFYGSGYVQAASIGEGVSGD